MNEVSVIFLSYRGRPYIVSHCRVINKSDLIVLYRKKLHTVYPMLYKPTLKNSKNQITHSHVSARVF